MRPLDYITQDILQCSWDPAPYLLFSNEVEPLVYYSHLFPALAALILATVVIVRTPKRLTSQIFSLIGILFAVYAVFDLILWATEKPSLIMFLWSLLTYIEPLIYALTAYLVLTFIRKRNIGLKEKIIGSSLLLPVFILGTTNLNLTGFDYTNCWRLATEGPLLYYVYFIEIIFAVWMIVAGVLSIQKEKDRSSRMSGWLLMVGALLFLLSFASGNIFGTLLQSVMGEESWIVAQYGFFGMPVFLSFIMYLMVRFELFNARVIYAEALLLGTFVTLLSLLLIPDIETARPIIGITILLFTILGFFLLHGIKNDLRQKQQIEHLAENLEKANMRLKELDKLKSEFVSIASHQLRSPITAIRGYASLLLEGSYGIMPQKAQEPLQRIEESSKLMAVAIEDYLNISRIESGNMKYSLADFNLKDEVEHICDDLRTEAAKKGLGLIFRSDLKSRGVINADLGKTVQIVQNLINNSLKYTPEGSIKVLVRDDIRNKKIFVDIVDTGIGMNNKTLGTIFQKFERADNANSVNIHGTGLGLFVALKMAEAMKGTITAHSEGDGKGSRFTLELPLAM